MSKKSKTTRLEVFTQEAYKSKELFAKFFLQRTLGKGLRLA